MPKTAVLSFGGKNCPNFSGKRIDKRKVILYFVPKNKFCLRETICHIELIVSFGKQSAVVICREIKLKKEERKG